MDLEECDRCGEEYPVYWQECPFCAATPKSSLRLRNEDD